MITGESRNKTSGVGWNKAARKAMPKDCARDNGKSRKSPGGCATKGFPRNQFAR